MKSPNPIRHPGSAGFTLLEVVVIATISIILVAVLMPASSHCTGCSRLADSLSNGKQITIALRLYAGDHDGKYPSTRSDGTTALVSGDASNRALELLLSNYSSSKKIFMNKGSAWCRNPATDATAADSATLRKGQNDWNYVAGLNDTDDARWPLIATATASATDLTYSNDPTAKGGVWGGTDAIIGYVDGSARQRGGGEMNLTNPTKTFPKRPDNGANIFTATPEWLGTGTFILAPE